MRTVTYILEFLGADKAEQSVDQVVKRGRELRNILKELPEEGTEAFDRISREVQEATNGTQRLEDIVETLTNEYAEGAARVRDFNRELRRGTAEAGSINDLRQAVISVNRELDNTAIGSERFEQLTRSSAQLTEELKEAEAASGRFQRNVGNYPRIAQGISVAFAEVGRTLVAAFSIGALIQGARQAITSVLDTARGFTQAFGNAAAIAGVDSTTEAFQALRNEALRLGSETSFTATQAAEGLTEFARAGFTTVEMLEVLEPTLRLAEAGQVELANAASITASAFRVFAESGITADEIVNQIAFTANSSLLSVESYGEALKEIGPIAQGLEIPLNEVSAAIGIIGDGGIQGTAATTVLRTAFARLAGDVKPVQDELKNLNLEVFNQQGEFIGLGSLLTELSERYSDFTDEQTQASISALFGNRAISQVNLLLENQKRALEEGIITTARGGESFREFAAQIFFAGQAVEGLAESISQESAISLRDLESGVRNLSTEFQSFGQSAPEAALGVLGVFSRLGVDVPETTETLASSLQTLSTANQEVRRNAEELGLTLENSNGQFIGLEGLITQVGNRFGDLTEQQRANQLATILNREEAENLAAVTGNVTRTLEDGTTVVQSIGEAYLEAANAAVEANEGARGFAATVAEAQLDNFAGALTLLESASEGLQLALFDLVENQIRSFIVGVNEAVTFLTDFARGNTQIQITLRENKILIEVLVATLGLFALALNAARIQSAALTLQERARAVAITAGNLLVRAAAVAQAAYTTAMAVLTGQITIASAAQQAFNFILSANPIGVVVVAVGALVAAIVLLYRNSQTAREIITGFFSSLRELGRIVVDAVLAPFRTLSGVLQGVFQIIKGDLQAGIDTIKGTVEARIDEFGNVGKRLGDAYGEGVEQAVRDNNEKIAQAVRDGVNEINELSLAVQFNKGEISRESVLEIQEQAEQAIAEALEQGAIDAAEAAELDATVDRKIADILAGRTPEARQAEAERLRTQEAEAKKRAEARQKEFDNQVDAFEKQAEKLLQLQREADLQTLDQQRLTALANLTQDRAFQELSAEQQLTLIREENQRFEDLRSELREQAREREAEEEALALEEINLRRQEQLINLQRRLTEEGQSLQEQRDQDLITEAEYAQQRAALLSQGLDDRLQIEETGLLEQIELETGQRAEGLAAQNELLNQQFDLRRQQIADELELERERLNALFDLQAQGANQTFDNVAQDATNNLPGDARDIRLAEIEQERTLALESIERERGERLRAVQEQSQQERLELTRRFTEQQTALVENALESLDTDQTETLRQIEQNTEARIQAERQSLVDERAALREQLEAREFDIAEFKRREAELVEDSENRITDIQEQSELERLRKTLEFLQRRTDVIGISADQEVKLREQIAAVQADIQDREIAAAETAADRESEVLEESLKSNLDRVKQFEETVGQVADIIGDGLEFLNEQIERNIEQLEEERESANEATEERIAALEEEFAAKQDSITQSGLSADQAIVAQQEAKREAEARIKAERDKQEATNQRIDDEIKKEEERAAQVAQAERALAFAQAAAAAIVATAQAVQAVTQAAAQTGVGAPIAIAAVLGAIAAGIGVARSLFRQEGGEIISISQEPTPVVFMEEGGSVKSRSRFSLKRKRRRRIRKVPRGSEITFGQRHGRRPGDAGILTELERGEYVSPIPTVQLFKPELDWMTEQGNNMRAGKPYSLTPPSNLFPGRNTSNPVNRSPAPGIAPTPRKTNGFAQFGGVAEQEGLNGANLAAAKQVQLLESLVELTSMQNEKLELLEQSVEVNRRVVLDVDELNDEIDFINEASSEANL
ncbi:MAG: phage tail tape measure protein [Bacteroidota bacterium]